MSLLRGEHARRLGRQVAGLALGGASALVETGLVLATPVCWGLPPARARLLRLGSRLAAWDVARVETYLGPTHAAQYTDREALRYLRTRFWVGWLGLGILVLIALGVVSVPFLVSRLFGDGLDDLLGLLGPITSVAFGALIAFVLLQGFRGVVDLELRTARRMLGPSTQDLQRRVSELAVSRSELAEAVTDERRRIERDLHDGIQQQLVALGMVLGRAARAVEPGRGADLVAQAREDAARALGELREVSWRVYPVGLDSEGLRVALRTLVERSGVPVTLDYRLDETLPRAVAVPAYFVASEAVTNASKHAGAARVDLTVERVGRMIVVTIADDGPGGADPSGTGLSGLARRVAAVDGTFRVESPAGGPTVVVGELPCE